jgi:hypothetical protein
VFGEWLSLSVPLKATKAVPYLERNQWVLLGWAVGPTSQLADWLYAVLWHYSHCLPPC